MKQLLSILLCVIAFYSTQAQDLNSYQYINIPIEFSGKRMNNYGLKDQLITALKSKNYIIIEGPIENWPSELRNNPCSIVKADLLNVSTLLKNRVRLELKDCNGNIIKFTEGGSDLKEYDEGYKEALKNALRVVKTSNPTTNIVSTEPKITDNSDSQVTFAPMDKEEHLSLQRINLSDTQFILVKSNSSTPYATFTKADKEGIYRVVLENKETAFGYSEKGKLIIEIPQKDGNYIKQIIEIK